MKINWGTGILLAFVAFISFILFFVVRTILDDDANHDLVTEEYYKVELGYQKEIDAANNAKRLSEKITTQKTKEGLLIMLPKEISAQKIKGIVSFYRPSNKHLDFDLVLSLSNSHLLIPDKRLLDGRWDIKISWENQGKPYLYKESIMY